MIRICLLSLTWALLLLESTPIVWSSPLEDRLLADAADGRWDQHTLIHAALISSEVGDSTTLLKLERHYASICQQLKKESWKTLPEGKRAKRLLRWLHENVLTGGYHEESSSLAQALDQGRFNCVSSAILYHALAEEIGLQTQLVALPEHVFVELKSTGNLGRIETTTPGGAFPASEGKNPAESNRLKPHRLESCRTLSQVQAVSLLYYNRGTNSFRQKDYAAAVASNLIAVRLDPLHAEARANLVSAINNWAVLLSEQKRYLQAQSLLKTGLTLAPGDVSLAANLRSLEQNQRSTESSRISAENVSTETPNP